jgi:hypothetical protein
MYFTFICPTTKDSELNQNFPEITKQWIKRRVLHTGRQIKELSCPLLKKRYYYYTEFDMPGHTKSWFAGYPQLSGSPEPSPAIDVHSLKQLDLGSIMQFNEALHRFRHLIRKRKYLRISRQVYREMSALFPSAYFHIWRR